VQITDSRITLGPFQHPIRGTLHGTAALLSFAVAVRFALAGAGAPLLVFALSQGALFGASALYHAIPWSPRWKGRMQRVDHSMIYVKIAGVVTLVAWIGLQPGGRALPIAAAWGLALLGAGQKLFLPRVHEKASILVQVFQCTLALPAVPGFADRLPGEPLALLAGGTACYVVGLVVFLGQRPRLWPRVFSSHELFHVLTVIGSGAHYKLALQYLLRLS
jgi:hemolysin III